MITTKFQQFPLPPDMLVNLEHLQFLEPTPVQAAVIPTALEGRDVLATAQTGTGKTAAFGIPLLTKVYQGTGERAVIMAPTRELGAQIFKVLRQLSHKMNILGSLVVGGESFNRQADELMRGVDYIVATPGRLKDHLDEGTIDLSQVSYLVLDEVDRMLDMGFLPQIQEIIRHIPVKRQTLLFSATLPKNMTSLAANLQTNAARIEIGHHSKPAEHVQQSTVQTTMEGKNALTLKELAVREGRVVIFTRTKARAERLSRFLTREGQTCVALHGDKHQSQRKMAMEAFRKGRARILVATDIAGRGIDVPDIEHVINYDVPMTREDYIHRIGRTGRSGKLGQAVTFVSPLDRGSERIITGVDPRKAAKSAKQAKGQSESNFEARQSRKKTFSKFSHGKSSFSQRKPFRQQKPREQRFDAPSFEEPVMGVVEPQADVALSPRRFQRSEAPRKEMKAGGRRPFQKSGEKRFSKNWEGRKPFQDRGEAKSFSRDNKKRDFSEKRWKKPFGLAEGANDNFANGDRPRRRFSGPTRYGKSERSFPRDEARAFRPNRERGFRQDGERPFRKFGGEKPQGFGSSRPFKKFGSKPWAAESSFRKEPREDGFTGWRSEDQSQPKGAFGPRKRKPGRFGGPRPSRPNQ